MEIVDLTTADRPAVARQVVQRPASDLVLNQVGQVRHQMYPDEPVEL
jgi:hypothetical protein